VKYLILLLFIISIENNLFAKTCNIVIPKVIIILNKKQNNIYPKIESSCPLKVIQKFLTLTANFEGEIKTSYLLKIFKDQFLDVQPILNQKMIIVIPIKKIINSRLELKKDLSVTDILSLDKIGFLLLDDAKDLSVNKLSEDLGEKNIKLTSRKLHRTWWLKGKLVKEITAYFAKKNIPFAEENLKESHFYKKIIITDNPKRYIVPIKKINFVKTVKALTMDTPIQVNDFTFKLLIKAFNSVEATYKNGPISVTYSLTALSNGRYGDNIKLKNNKTKKVVIGKVIAANTVQIGL